MDADPEDPEPGAPVQRAFFYGLWPRFTLDGPEWAHSDADAAVAPVADA
jgi:hypothetical protein